MNDIVQTNRQAYNLIAEDWHKDHQRDDWWVKGTDTLISYLKPGDLVLDVGCGGGTKTKYLAHRKLDVLGIDIADKLLAIAQREVPNAQFQVLDLDDISTLEQTFDAIFMQAVLLHVPKEEVAPKLKSALTRLKDDGYLYIAVKEIKPKQSEEEIKTENDYGYTYSRFFSYFTQSEIEEYMKKCGLKIVFSEVFPSGNARWIQVIGKK